MEPIVDGHGHIFPPLAGACGFESAKEHLLYLQYAMHTHNNQPVVRSRDGAVVAHKPLWSANDPSEAGRIEGLNFRVAGDGRLAWETDGESYHIQYLSPAARQLESPAETIIAQMDYVGVDRMVLQNDHIYGNSAEIFAAAMDRYPGRFIGLAQVEEGFAFRDREIARLEAQVETLGMKGLYFTLAGFMRSGWEKTYLDPDYRQFWQTVERLDLPVFWVFPANSPWGDFLAEMDRFSVWLGAYPTIKSVLVHGWPTAMFADEKGRIAWPETVARLQEEHQVYPELLYPISWGRAHEYPYQKALEHIRQTYDRFGARHLIWGSDMPNVERYCTYRQSLAYVKQHCGFMTDGERAGVFGQTCLSLFAPTKAG